MSDQAQDTIIASIPKNSREELRVTLGEFKGHRLCQLRAWALRDGAESIPTKNGFGIQAAVIPKLREALAEAETEARRRGWIEGGA
jgi:hypothetical protein